MQDNIKLQLQPDDSQLHIKLERILYFLRFFMHNIT